MDLFRKAVAEGLVKVENSGYANVLLANMFANLKADKQQRAFVNALFYGALERINTIDYILNTFLQKPLATFDAEVRAILRSAVFELKYMGAAKHYAVISEAVTLCRVMRHSSAAGLVNAVLRKVATGQVAFEFTDETQRLQVMYSVDISIVAVLVRDYGIIEAEEILSAFYNKKGDICVRVNTHKIAGDELVAQLTSKGVQVRRGFDENCLYLGLHGSLQHLKEFEQGLFHVQGEASQFAVANCRIKSEQTVIDVCAAPGGKSATAAQLAGDSGRVFACDIHPHRVQTMAEAFHKLGLENISTLVADGTVKNSALPQADVVMVDAPCGGIGVIAKKPDIRYKNIENIGELTDMQFNLLQNSSNYVKKGGTLVYSTCTINKMENEAVVARFLAANNNFKTVKPLVFENAIVCENAVTLLPHKTGTDGFFIACFTCV